MNGGHAIRQRRLDPQAPKQPVCYGIGDELICDLLPGWRRRVADIFADRLSAEAVAGEVADAWRTEGIAIGKQEGERSGLRQDLLTAIELGLELKFGDAGLALVPAIRQVQNLETLRGLAEGIKTVPTLSELRHRYALG